MRDTSWKIRYARPTLADLVRIVLAYICVTEGVISADFAARFVGSYLACPPEAEHKTVIVCNGGPLRRELSLLFDPLAPAYLPRVNDGGWDLSAYLDVAHKIPCDMLVCLGESVYFHRPRWLRRMVQAWEKYGPGLYGFWASNLVRPHLNTTAFVCDPNDLKTFMPPTNRKERYEAEHGQNSWWRTLQFRGKPTMLVTWDGVWQPMQWRTPRDILWRGSQTNTLAYCTHTDRYNAADTKTKAKWARAADAPYR